MVQMKFTGLLSTCLFMILYTVSAAPIPVLKKHELVPNRKFEFHDLETLGGDAVVVTARALRSSGSLHPRQAAAAVTPDGAGGAKDVVREGTFNTAVALAGGNVKQDTEFKSTSGKFEVEFQSPDANSLTVTTKVTTGIPPNGFSFIDVNSFAVKTTGALASATLLKIDYIFDPASSLVAGVDTSKAVIGKLCTGTNVFVVDNLGESEFETEENEVTVKVKDLNGEWAVLAPTSAFRIDVAKQATEGKTELQLKGVFNTPLQFPGGNLKADVLFPSNAAGSFEVEHTGRAAVSMNVQARVPSAQPPAGFMFIDPQSFVVTTIGDTAGASLLKIDYIFSAGIKAVVDASKGVIGKFDAATAQFVTANLGEFEFEEDEDEWTLKVKDLNGEWAVMIPTTAVKNLK